MSIIFGAETATGSNTANVAVYDHSPIFGELMLLFTQGNGTNLPAAPSGWTIMKNRASAAGNTVSVHYRSALGADGQPTVAAIAAISWRTRICQVPSGLIRTVTPLDATPTTGTNGTTSPLVVTNSAADLSSGELVVVGSSAHYTASATKTLTNTITTNSVAVTGQVDSNNNATSAQDHYAFSVAFTPNNGAADSNSFSYTTTSISGAATVIGSFKLLPGPRLIICQAVTRAATR